MTATFFVKNHSETTRQSFEQPLNGFDSADTTTYSTLDWTAKVTGLEPVVPTQFPYVGTRDVYELSITEQVGTKQISRLVVSVRLLGGHYVWWTNRLDFDDAKGDEDHARALPLVDMPADIAAIVEEITGDPIDGFTMIGRA
jgi:hypothetical protein